MKDAREIAFAEVVQYHDRLETRDELRRHPVAKEIVVFDVVAKMERQLFAHFAGGGDDHDRLHRLDVLPDHRAAQHVVVQLLERAAGDEEDVRRVDRHRFPIGLELDVLVLHQR